MYEALSPDATINGGAASAALRKPLPRGFYARPTTLVAADAIGKFLVSRSADGVAVGRIVETEAYLGPEDRAAHSHGGRRTARTEAMWGAPGHAYVFMIYGMHFHFNLVTARKGAPEAVLIRAVEPVVGAELMSARRAVDVARRELTNGPGKLCEAFAIGRDDYGLDLCDASSRLFLADGPPSPRVARSARIGVDYAGIWANEPLRYFDPESRYVAARTRTRTRTRTRRRAAA
ncbi:MAG TPA: DNA-3-methyladenine glycosylase [Polyangiaceae bacterium]|nr:DNA-3-methyladenine glycosylase [Polyangiaceae bacterium]